MIPLTIHHLWWGRSEVVIIYLVGCMPGLAMEQRAWPAPSLEAVRLKWKQIDWCSSHRFPQLYEFYDVLQAKDLSIASNVQLTSRWCCWFGSNAIIWFDWWWYHMSIHIHVNLCVIASLRRLLKKIMDSPASLKFLRDVRVLSWFAAKLATQAIRHT